MNFHIKHLQRFIEREITENDLSEVLFQLGHENNFKDGFFELELTPNRGDCLSLMGLARDLNYFFGHTSNLEIFNKDIQKFEFNFINNAPDACTNISFLFLEIEDIPSHYKDYLNSFFTELGNKKINFFTDVSNYLSYEIGQPTHCYEYDSIREGFELKRLEERCNFLTLNDEKISLEEGDLVFSKNGEVINLAGVMGGKSTACNENTKKVLIECAHFKPNEIIGKTIKYNITSDAAHKFERFVDPNTHNVALKRFLKIVDDHTKIKKIGLAESNINKKEPKSVNLDINKINSILGTNLKREAIEQILNKLSFSIIANQIQIPSHRNEIENVNDISEEVARVIGYDNINSESFKLKTAPKKTSYKENLRRFLLHNGFTEVINSQFSPNKNEDSISIQNPLDSNKSNLRTNLSESLLENLLYNERRQKQSIKLFEISDIYKFNSERRIEIRKVLGLIVSGRVGNNYEEFSKKCDEKYLKEVFNKINFDVSDFIFKFDRSDLNSKRKEDIFTITVPLEHMEKVFDEESSYVSKIKEKVYDKDFKYSKVSDYPASTRDFSFVVSDKEIIDSISQTIFEFHSNILKDVFLFDFYEDVSNKQFKAAFRFIFQDDLKTLTDEEINSDLDIILSRILNLGNVSIPGYKKNES